MASRRVRLTDRNGAALPDASIAELARLLDSLTPDGDDEHASVSLTDEDEWNLEFYRDRVLFENVGEEGVEVGVTRSGRADRLAMGQEFLDGDLAALRARFSGRA